MYISNYIPSIWQVYLPRYVYIIIGQYKNEVIKFYIIWNFCFVFIINHFQLESTKHKRKLLKLEKKNKGNKKLTEAIRKLIKDIENADWKNSIEIEKDRPDADNIHSEGFYFFNLNIHRTMILVVFEDSEASIVWTGNHKEYDKTFKGNKSTIEKWLKNQNLISLWKNFQFKILKKSIH